MDRNKRFTLWIVSLLVLGLAALAVLYIPLRRAADAAPGEAGTSVPGGEDAPDAEGWPGAEELDRYLAVREAAYPVYARDGEIIEEGLYPGAGHDGWGTLKPMAALKTLIDTRAAALGQQGMALDRYYRLTELVYLRFWRAVREGPPHEKRLVAALRRTIDSLDNPAPDEDPAELREREKVRTQLAFLESVLEADPRKTLEAIPAGALSLLQEGRERIGAIDMGLLDALEVEGWLRSAPSR
jgi:hypothetical protein